LAYISSLSFPSFLPAGADWLSFSPILHQNFYPQVIVPTQTYTKKSFDKKTKVCRL
jgi:hypothetical protein